MRLPQPYHKLSIWVNLSLQVLIVAVTKEHLVKIDVVGLAIVGIVDVVVDHVLVLHITDQWDVVDLCSLGNVADSVSAGTVSSVCVIRIMIGGDPLKQDPIHMVSIMASLVD